jgi:hypothetical protein
MSEKPEWFKITEDDVSPTENPSKKSFLKVLAVTLPLLVAGVVAVNANGDSDSKVSQTEENATSVTTVSNESTEAAQSSAIISTATVSKSVGVPLPTAPNGGDEDGHQGFRPDHDDDDDDFEGFRPDHDDDEDDDGHEKRERHHEGRRTAPTIPQPGTTSTIN